MAIRSAVKTIVIKENKVLLIIYLSAEGLTYYELPGGGQIQFEELEDAARREFMEETGYKIKIKRFAAIAEEIYTDEELRNKVPDYVHRIHHIFEAELESDAMEICSELDKNQVGCEWMPIEKISEIYLNPKQLKENFNTVIKSDKPVYLGTDYVGSNYRL
jgi:8-oxo-dGTP diphosphatase